MTPHSTFGHTSWRTLCFRDLGWCRGVGTWGDAEELEQTFQWVYQMQFQKEMLAKYGNIMTLLDVTYKTKLYNLALLFITVQTHGCCRISCQQIEALNLLKQWNPQWSPTYFRFVYSKAEILTIKTAFPTATVHLCDVDREQSWERWLRNHQHGLTDEIKHHSYYRLSLQLCLGLSLPRQRESAGALL